MIGTWRGRVVALGLVFTLSGCIVPTATQDAPTPNAVAATDAVATEIAFGIMEQGGNAVDAAVAAGLAMAVSLPSRVSLGSSGSCVLAEVQGRISTERGADRQVIVRTVTFAGPDLAGTNTTVPSLVRGLAAVHAEGGALRWAQVVAPAEQRARFGFRYPRTLAQDLAFGASAGLTDPELRALLLDPEGRPRPVGSRIARPRLADTLAALRNGGPLARPVWDAFAAEVAPADADAAAAAMRRWAPRIVDPVEVGVGNHLLALASQRSAAAWPGGDTADAEPRTAVVATLSEDDVAAACAFTLNGWFGTGVAGAETGILPARPGPVPDRVGIMYNPFTLNLLAVAAGVSDTAFNMPVLAVAEADATAAAAVAAGGGGTALIACRTDRGVVTGCDAAADADAGGLSLSGF